MQTLFRPGFAPALLLPLLLVSPASSREPEAASPAESPPPPLPRSREILLSLEPDSLRSLAAEVLTRNPSVARAERRAAAASHLPPQVAKLGDPMATVQWFLMSPETRVGPQEWAVGLAQTFPWFGKLELREQAALYAVARAEAEVETARLDVLTETRRRFFELAFLDQQHRILLGERAILARVEGAARARYSAGAGLQQEILRIQAQITRIDERLLVTREHSAHQLAALNGLRDSPADRPVEGLSLPQPSAPTLPPDRLRLEAIQRRPEIRAAEVEIARRATLVELAKKSFKPDFNVSLAYTEVARRKDRAGQQNPPEGNGDDILVLSSTLNLPVRRGRLDAKLEQALEEQRAAEEERRRVAADVERDLGDLSARIPFLFEHWNLLQNVLLMQATEALRSAEAAYTTGKLNAVDLLDAEVVLFEVRTGAARTRADYAIALAELERAAALPLNALQEATTE